METIYRKIKTKDVVNVSQMICKNFYNPEAMEEIETMAKEKNVTVIVTDLYGQIYYISDMGKTQGFSTIEGVRYYLLLKEAQKNGGEVLYEGLPDNKKMEMDDRYFPGKPYKVRTKDDSVTYTKIIQGERNYGLFVIGNIAPVEATVSTIRMELLYVTVIMLIIAFLLSFYIARKVAGPIIKINAQAKLLAKNYNEEITFDGEGYREISELASTLSFATTELARTENLRRELIANVSHDLRTPLTLICGYAEMMRDLPGENNPENTQVIIDEATRLTALVNDMLDLSKLQAGMVQLDRHTYNLTVAIENIMKRYVALTEKEGYEISFDHDEEVYIEADELKISQVVYNLINNAINYTGDNKKVAVHQKIVNNKVRIEVSDTGEGISEENLPYIWDRYYKIDKTHKRAAIGTGLGLSIVQSILKAHKAAYGVESKVGQGSTFWFEITYRDNAE